MSDDWQPGDSASCLTDIFRPALRLGGVYIVAEVVIGNGQDGETDCVGLSFIGKPPRFPFIGWDARQFRKLDPLVEAVEREELEPA